MGIWGGGQEIIYHILVLFKEEEMRCQDTTQKQWEAQKACYK